MRTCCLLAAALMLPAFTVQAQETSAPDPQIASAVQPLPAEFRDGATVLGYRSGSTELVTIREGSGPFICLADNPAETPRFHVACYHQTLSDFMARGRALRAQGVENVDSVRYAEIDAGTLAMPEHAAALYSLTAESGAPDASGVVAGAQPLTVVYIRGATPETTGISAQPKRGEPWLMFPGTARAHIMFVPSM